MNVPWTFVRSWEIDEVKDSWKQEFNEYGFCFVVKCTNIASTSQLDWNVTAKPDGDCVYTLLITYEFSVTSESSNDNSICFMVEKDILEDESILASAKLSNCTNLKVLFRLRVLDTLAAQDLTVRTAYRNFELICEGKSFFVDVSYLSCLGGNLFPKWAEEAQKGVNRKVITDLSLSELQCLLDATAKCRQILVTRKNYDEFLQIAFRFGIEQALRMIENFLIDASWINPIPRLGDNVSSQLLSSGKAIEVLHRYLAENGETLEQVHPDVLLSLNFFPNYVLI
uniref:BTB domain-containing protein n=1 Tax=Syphacia muris TaxID=451379 RepID=A0A0N5A844_9BILA